MLIFPYKSFVKYISGVLFSIGALVFAVNMGNASALKFIRESFIPSSSNKIEYIGNSAGGQFGSIIASGDVNNDGLEDLIASSPFASINEKEWNGSVRIIFGSIDGSRDHVSMEYYGEDSGDQLGTALAVGDFNNDFIDDVAIGAYNAQDSGIRPGKVYIIYGKNGLNSQVSTQQNIREMIVSYSMVNTMLLGKDSGDQFGISLASLDVNNDGIDDLVVGAPFAWGQDFYKSGAVYVFFGAKDGIPSNPNYSLYAKSPNEKFGAVLSGGHIISKETDDIAVGAYLADKDGLDQSGRVYVFKFNNTNNTSSERFSKVTLSGNTDKGWFGFSMAVGNLNNDEYDDLAVSTFPYKGDHSEAKISIFYGNNKINKSAANIVIKNPESEAFLGASVILKDMNSDNLQDIILGAPNIATSKSGEEGKVYIINNNDGFVSEYDIQNYGYDTIIHGEIADDWFGADMNVLDFNHDGKKDIAVGSRYGDSINSINNGKVFVIFGDSENFGRLRPILNQDDQKVSRGELVKITLDHLNIREKKSDYLQNCYDFRDFCLFNFTTMSGYKDLTLEPEIILYPDVQPDNTYYDDINIATMLGLVNGYLSEDNSPFHPELPVTRIQALKIVLGAADLVPQRYQFELIALLGSYDNLLKQITPFVDMDAKISSAWWQPRYVNFAVENNIVDKGDFFRPNDDITAEELDNLLNRTVKYLESKENEL